MIEGKPIPPEDLIDLTNENDDADQENLPKSASTLSNPPSKRVRVVFGKSAGQSNSAASGAPDPSPSTSQPNPDASDAGDMNDDNQFSTGGLREYRQRLQHLAFHVNKDLFYSSSFASNHSSQQSESSDCHSTSPLPSQVCPPRFRV